MCSLGVYLGPGELLVAKFEFVQVIVSGLAIIPAKDIHASFIENSSVISSWRGRLVVHAVSLEDRLPYLCIDVEVKQVVEVRAFFPLIAPEEVKPVHIGNTAGA